jgi:hypothetical protein
MAKKTHHSPPPLVFFPPFLIFFFYSLPLVATMHCLLINDEPNDVSLHPIVNDD